jgi:uncharacterized protein (TIGR02145 family)
MNLKIFIKSLILFQFCFSFHSNAQINNSVKIGNQYWMTENLNVDRFRNGDPIPQAVSNKDWLDASKNRRPAWCYYENNKTYGDKFGKLYNWYAVNDKRGLAPKGFHIPSEEEFKQLEINLGLAGIPFKSTTGWKNSGIGSNENRFKDSDAGFNGVGAGRRAALQGYVYEGRRHANDANFYDKYLRGNFWTSDEHIIYTMFNEKVDDEAVFFELEDSRNSFNRSINDKGSGLSVRCIIDNNSSYSATNDSYRKGETISFTKDNNTPSNDCDKIVEDYLVFAREAIAYYNRIKKNLSTTSFSEYSNWDLEIRKQQSIVNKCVDKDISYGIKILDVMNELATAIASFSGKSSNSFTSNNNSNSSSNNTPNSKKVCRDCRCPDEEGWYISDFNAANKTYPNGRYVLRPGYIKCDACQGTGDCRNLKSQYPTIWCENGYTCKQCHGERFVICKSCKGSGYSK